MNWPHFIASVQYSNCCLLRYSLFQIWMRAMRISRSLADMWGISQMHTSWSWWIYHRNSLAFFSRPGIYGLLYQTYVTWKFMKNSEWEFPLPDELSIGARNALVMGWVLQFGVYVLYSGSNLKQYVSKINLRQWFAVGFCQSW